MLLKLVYLGNIVVAGTIAFTSLYSPRLAATTVFGNAYAPTEVMRLVGCLWLAIAVLSLLGLFRPDYVCAGVAHPVGV